MLTYASYMKKGTDLVQAGGYIVLLNILVTLLAGLAIFPATASLGIDNAQGPGYSLSCYLMSLISYHLAQYSI